MVAVESRERPWNRGESTALTRLLSFPKMKRNVFLGGSRLKTPSETCIDSKKRFAGAATKKFKMFANLWNWNLLTIVLFADWCDFVLQNLERLADAVEVSLILSVQIHDFGHNHFRKISSIIWCSLPMWRMVQRTARLKIQTLAFEIEGAQQSYPNSIMCIDSLWFNQHHKKFRRSNEAYDNLQNVL